MLVGQQSIAPRPPQALEPRCSPVAAPKELVFLVAFSLTAFGHSGFSCGSGRCVTHGGGTRDHGDIGCSGSTMEGGRGRGGCTGPLRSDSVLPELKIG